MSGFKIFDGTNWVDPCDCALNILNVDAASWQPINPNDCNIKYFDGVNWCPIECQQTCLDFLQAGECGSIPPLIQFLQANCNTIFPGQGCNGLVLYVPIKLNNTQNGFTLNFRPYQAYDGIDVVDVCNQTVLGGVGMYGSGTSPISFIVNPGTYTYNKFIYYDFTTTSFVILTGYPSFDMTFKYPVNCINDWTPTPTGVTTQVCATTGYQNLASQGDPLPAINEMYLPRKLSGTTDLCTIPGNKMENVDFIFNRPPAPVGGYPLEETFLIRVFGHPVLASTGFDLSNIQCF